MEKMEIYKDKVDCIFKEMLIKFWAQWVKDSRKISTMNLNLQIISLILEKKDKDGEQMIDKEIS